MTVPFLKNKEGSISQGIDHIRMGGDEDSEYGMLDALAADFLHAFEKKDAGMLKAALQSLCDHIMSIDEEQDKEFMEE